MKKRRILIFLLVLLVGCNKSNPEATQTGEFTPTPGLATPVVQTTQTPDVETTAVDYLNSWKDSNFQAMYELLNPVSQARISEEEFSQLHHDFAVELALESLDYRILSSFIDPAQAQVAVSVDYYSRLIEGLSREIILMLTLADGEWKIEWSKALIFPELEGENQLRLTRIVPSRGNIYDRNGRVIVAYAEAVSLGITPSQIDPEQEENLLKELDRDLDIPWQVIAAMYEDFPPGVDWYIPLGAISMDTIEGRLGILYSYTTTGLLLRTFEGRYYFSGGVAPQSTGYVRWIQEAEEDDYRILGYSRDEKVGGQGLEKWGEPYLSGDRGGILFVVDAEGAILSRLAQSEAGPASEIYTTIDKEFQLKVQKALYGFNGAIVVLELDTGRVLAMVSNPHFDPNAFNSNYFNSNLLLQEYYKTDQKPPLLNRATQGLYPLGSVFKIITMAAGLESGEFQAGDIYTCGYFFEELAGVTLTDWTYDHFLEDDKTLPSGDLTLTEGLMRSCNPYFWHIGLDLYRKGLTDAVSEMAKGFGLGSLTGIETLEEEAGNIPVPKSELDATNLAIGQGETLVTPLQVAQFIIPPPMQEQLSTVSRDSIYPWPEKQAPRSPARENPTPGLPVTPITRMKTNQILP
jgi:penicillin-binding protein 2